MLPEPPYGSRGPGFVLLFGVLGLVTAFAVPRLRRRAKPSPSGAGHASAAGEGPWLQRVKAPAPRRTPKALGPGTGMGSKPSRPRQKSRVARAASR